MMSVLFGSSDVSKVMGSAPSGRFPTLDPLLDVPTSALSSGLRISAARGPLIFFFMISEVPSPRNADLSDSSVFSPETLSFLKVFLRASEFDWLAGFTPVSSFIKKCFPPSSYRTKCRKETVFRIHLKFNVLVDLLKPLRNWEEKPVWTFLLRPGNLRFRLS